MTNEIRLAALVPSSRYIPALFLAFAIGFVSVFAPGFASFQTLVLLLSETTVLFVMATGLTFVIVIGGIDLSVPSVASMTTVVAALLLPRFGAGALVCGLMVGSLAGLFSGLVHVGLRIPSFIATLATGGIVFSASLVVADARSVPIAPEFRAPIDWMIAKSWGVPNLVFVGACVLAVAGYIQHFSHFGRYSVAIGASESAAAASGVQIGREKVIAFVLSGFFASVGGLLLTGRMTSGSPQVASELLLPTIAAVIVGGTAITGGVGGVSRTLVGALIVSVVRIGMTFVGVDVFAQQIVFGSVLIFAAAITMDRANVQMVK
jgi:ribose transport system permease protein